MYRKYVTVEMTLSSRSIHFVSRVPHLSFNVFLMRSSSCIFTFSSFILITSRIIISTATSCSEDYDCFPSGGRSCCLNKCSGRKYCGNYCTYNGDCDISKQENCIGNKCTTQVRTLKPGHCRYSYECDSLTEICERGVCKKIKGVNGATDIPKSNGGTNSGSSNSLTVVLLATIIPAIIVVALIFSVCVANCKIRALRNRGHVCERGNIQTRHEQSEMQSINSAVTTSQITPCPLPSAPPLPPYDALSGGTPPSQAPPSYDEVIKSTTWEGTSI